MKLSRPLTRTLLPGPQQTRSKLRLSTTAAIPSAGSPSDLLPGGQIPALHLCEWSSAHRQRAICKRDWISFDSVQKSKKDSFWMRWWNPLGFQKPSVVVLFTAMVKRTRLLLTESMACSFLLCFCTQSTKSIKYEPSSSWTHNNSATTLGPIMPVLLYCNDRECLPVGPKKKTEILNLTLALH